MFPEPGKVNIKFYEQSLLSNMRINVGDDDKNFDEEVADIEIDDNEEDNVENAGIFIEERFKSACLVNDAVAKNKLNENDIETGIERYEESLG